MPKYELEKRWNTEGFFEFYLYSRYLSAG